MKRRLTWAALLSAAIVITPLYLAQRVHATPNNDHHGGCSVASLKGTYAFRRTGVNNVIGGPIAQIGINREDGDGRILFIRTTRSQNGEILDWFDQQAPGSYTVDPDCTGTFFNKSQNLVVLDGGKRYLLLSVAPGTIVTEEGTRLEE
ncbi:MAG: hypothetical protein JO358_17935 [Alphaproteobacteria bacterium]|nr:hypothetical protein [Acetobacteraceae bacterium]MBV8337279.1 hypothetical protein [Alphaproteobacteria bacterium]